MIVKKFEAESMEKALSLVKSELGPSALILSTQQKKGSWFQRSLVEVTAAFERREKEEMAATFDEEILRKIFPDRERSRKVGAGQREQAQPAPSPTPSRGRFSAAAPAAGNKRAGVDAHEAFFIRRGFVAESAKELARRLVYDYPSKDLLSPAFLSKVRMKLVATSIRTLNPDLLHAKSSWAALGVSGSGKTSLVVKLALHLKGKKIPSALIGCDKRKLTAQRELAAYARLIQAPFYSDPEKDKGGDRVQLVDTPSLSTGDESASAKLEEICRRRSCILVLDAMNRLEEMIRIVEKTRKLNPVAIAFTRLDLASQHGVLYDVLKKTKLPLLGASLASSFTTPFRFFEPTELAHFILEANYNPSESA